MRAYYNEFDPFAAHWLRSLIAAGHLPAGDVDERSIRDVRPDDLAGYTQCHFFAGIGGWAYALRLAGWPDDRSVWTGSPPCQPFSVAGSGKGQADDRHLWPAFFGLVRECRPTVIFGEQVAAAVGKNWLDGVCVDLEGIDNACGAVVVPACAVNAPHRRDRLWFVADAQHSGCAGRHAPGQGATANLPYREGHWGGAMAHAGSAGSPDAQQRGEPGTPERGGEAGPAIAERSGASRAWDGAEWIIGADGKARRVEPGIRLLAHGIPGRVGRLRAYGNAIVPQVAAEVIAAYMALERRPGLAGTLRALREALQDNAAARQEWGL